MRPQKSRKVVNDAESDEELEAALRRELIARFNGISDPKTLKDILWPPAY